MSLSRYLPAGTAARFALLLAAALLAANLVALGLLSFERDRLDREAGAAREVERIVSLVPAMEALPRPARQALARRASTRLARIEVGPAPRVATPATGNRAAALEARLRAALPDRELRVAIRDGRPRHGEAQPGGVPDHGRGSLIAASISLDGGAEWLNVTAAMIRPPDGLQGRVLLLVLGLSLLSVLAVGMWFLRQLTRPLGALATAARKAGRGDRTVRVPETGAREMRAAAMAFNDMQARIARFEAERTRTLAAVGHDLRTPITSLRIRAEMLDEDEGAPMIRTLDEMAVMAEGLVSFARSGQEAEPVAEIDLAALLQHLCGERGASCQVEPGPMLRGRRVALSRAIGNLVDNALRYGGTAHVALSQEGGKARITVEDEGPGIPGDLLSEMFEPFVRGEESRSADTGGAGLGLSIARGIIRAHGGEIRLSNRAGGGLVAEVTLPLG